MNYQNMSTEALMFNLTQIVTVLLVRESDGISKVDSAVAFAIDNLLSDFEEPSLNLLHEVEEPHLRIVH